MLSKPYSSVIVTGSLAYDEIMDFPGYFADYFHPERLHQINVSFVVSQLERQLGGTACNIAYNISLLTRKNVKILAAVGKDGARLVNFLNNNKVDVSRIKKDRYLYSSCGTVFTDKNDNQIWGYYYGAAVKAKKIKLRKKNIFDLLLVISANHQDVFLNFQKQAINNNIDYLYDPGMMVTNTSEEQLTEGILNCRYLVGNDYEIANILRLTKLTLPDIVKKGIAVITTLGEKGVRYEEQVNKVDKVHKVAAYKVKKVIDPTGAGDAWRGGFVAGILEQKSVEECLKLGNVMASFAIEKYGTVNHRPSRKEIDKRIKMI